MKKYFKVFDQLEDRFTHQLALDKVVRVQTEEIINEVSRGSTFRSTIFMTDGFYAVVFNKSYKEYSDMMIELMGGIL